MNGFLVINKAVGLSSFKVVNKIRYMFGEKSVGHCGTLDPFAEGVLILALGRYTKLLFLFDAMDKEYIAEGIFGEAKDTDDVTGVTTRFGNWQDKVSKEEIKKIIKESFSGKLNQAPPIYSAKQINGVRAYNLARSGVEFSLKDVTVNIKNIELINYNYPFFSIKTSVSKGTYIRSIIRDIGIITGHLAYTNKLIRTAIGFVSLKDSVPLKEAKENNLFTFNDFFPNIQKIIVSDESTKKKLLCGNTHIIENIKIENNILAFVDEQLEPIAIIKQKENYKDEIVSYDKKKNIYLFVNN